MTRLHPFWLTGLALLASPPATAQWFQAREIVSPSAEDHDRAGESLVFRGSLVVVGAPGGPLGPGPGAVLVHDAPSGQELLELVPTAGAPGDNFGSSVDLDLASQRVLIGAERDDDLGDNAGAVYLFDLGNGAELAKWTAADGAALDFFGAAVALVGDRALVGALYDDDKGSSSGSAYVFDVATGTQLHKLTASDGGKDAFFGNSVALDGTRAYVGAITDDELGSGAGAVYVFDLATGVQLDKWTASNARPNGLFGHSIAVSGGRALVGASGDSDLGTFGGAAYLIDAVGGAELLQLLPSDGHAGIRFGYSVAFEDDLALVGAASSPTFGSFSGAAYAFDLASGAELGKLIASDGDQLDTFGVATGVAGGLLAIGAPGHDHGADQVGAVYIYADGCSLRYCSPAVANSTGLPGRIEVGACALSGSVLVTAGDLPANQFGYLLVGSGSGVIPFPPGSSGDLCLGGSSPGIGRYTADVASSGSGGTLSTDLVDGATGAGIGMLPNPPGGVLAAGDSWNFQYWYRDAGTSNFTDAVLVAFVP